MRSLNRVIESRYQLDFRPQNERQADVNMPLYIGWRGVDPPPTCAGVPQNRTWAEMK